MPVNDRLPIKQIAVIMIWSDHLQRVFFEMLDLRFSMKKIYDFHAETKGFLR